MPSITYPKKPGVIALMLCSMLLAGCATLPADNAATTADHDPLNNDPWEPANRVSYDFNETLDDFVMQPVAEFYTFITPAAVRESVGNFFTNLGYLNVIMNDFLQGKLERGWSDSSRFVINSTLGIGGLFDVATDLGYPRHDEDLGQTLAVWGSGQGAYLYLPLVGPNSVREAPDLITSLIVHPLFYVTSAVAYPLAALGLVNRRAELLDASRMRDAAAVDAYVFTREAYLQQREYLIYDGNPPASGYDDLFDDVLDAPATDSATGAATPP